MLLSVREHIRARQFGGLPMQWRLVYWKDHLSNNVQPTKDWGRLAARAQFLDQNASFPKMCILFKRVCPSKYLSFQPKREKASDVFILFNLLTKQIVQKVTEK